jgi:hypothetical protein
MSRDDEQGYPEPPAVGDQVATLLGSLERQRATLAWKCANLDAVGLRASVGASSVTLGGLLKHLAYMEDLNFSPGTWPDATCRHPGTLSTGASTRAGSGGRPMRTLPNSSMSSGPMPSPALASR